MRTTSATLSGVKTADAASDRRNSLDGPSQPCASRGANVETTAMTQRGHSTDMVAGSVAFFLGWTSATALVDALLIVGLGLVGFSFLLALLMPPLVMIWIPIAILWVGLRELVRRRSSHPRRPGMLTSVGLGMAMALAVLSLTFPGWSDEDPSMRLPMESLIAWAVALGIYVTVTATLAWRIAGLGPISVDDAS
jgi:hypothetical protein